MTIHRYEVTDAEWAIIEPMLPISFSVNGGDVLMIKAIRTNNEFSSYCYITDTALTVLE